jgi:hypothetical protein
MLAPEVDNDPKKEVNEVKKEAPSKEPEKKEWHPFLVVDHNLRPQGWFNDHH